MVESQRPAVLFMWCWCIPWFILQELFEAEDRKKLAIFTALTFSQKLSGLPAETIFSALLSDSLVAKGLVLGFVTDFFKEYLVDYSLDDLVGLLKRAKMEDRLLDFFPMQKRTLDCFAEHFRFSVHFLVSSGAFEEWWHLSKLQLLLCYPCSTLWFVLHLSRKMDLVWEKSVWGHSFYWRQGK